MIILPALPVRNQNVGMVYNGAHFTAKECDKIVASIDPTAWQQGGVGGHSAAGTGTVNEESRRCSEQRLPVDPQGGYPLSRIIYEVCNVNSNGWRFDLSGFVSDDVPYIMRYEDSNQGHYDWHMDMGRGQNASRKLGFSIQLSDGADYEGGDLEFHNANLDKEAVRARGTLLLFPAYWLHRVTPVTKGVRQVVVGWVHGPSYR